LKSSTPAWADSHLKDFSSDNVGAICHSSGRLLFLMPFFTVSPNSVVTAHAWSEIHGAKQSRVRDGIPTEGRNFNLGKRVNSGSKKSGLQT